MSITSSLWPLLYFCWILSELLILILTRTRRSSGRVHDRNSLRILWLVLAGSMTASQWIAAVNPPNMFQGAHWLKTAALITIAIGLAIRLTAVISLGKAFSANVAILETQTVKTSGLYRFVRHPSYSGLLLILLATGLHTRNWFALSIAVIPTTAALLYRIQVEEAALNSAFGEDYAAYSKRTKRLIPGLL